MTLAQLMPVIQFCGQASGAKLLEHMGPECLSSHYGGANEGIHMGLLLRPPEPEES